MRLFATLWTLTQLWLAVALPYLLGSVLSADIAARIASRRDEDGVDLRAAGSGNPGAANTASQLGYRWGLGVLAGDMAKGAVGAWIGRRLAGDRGAYLGAAASVVGHCFPAWTGGRGGGKGVATSAGTTWIVFPLYIPFDLVMIGVSYAYSRHATLATVVTSSTFVAASFVWHIRKLPNAWGPRPSAWLPVYAALTTGAIAYKFLVPARREPPSPGG